MVMNDIQKRQLIWGGLGVLLGLGIYVGIKYFRGKQGEESKLFEKLKIVRQLKGNIPSGAGKGNAPTVGRQVRSYD